MMTEKDEALKCPVLWSCYSVIGLYKDVGISNDLSSMPLPLHDWDSDPHLGHPKAVLRSTCVR